MFQICEDTYGNLSCYVSKMKVCIFSYEICSWKKYLLAEKNTLSKLYAAFMFVFCLGVLFSWIHCLHDRFNACLHSVLTISWPLMQLVMEATSPGLLSASRWKMYHTHRRSRIWNFEVPWALFPDNGASQFFKVNFLNRCQRFQLGLWVWYLVHELWTRHV